jgi:3-methyl-2-oxobutanoate hydroxymethyltransferase
VFGRFKVPVTILDLARFKVERRRFVMLTAYDFPTAAILDQSGIPVIFVGDTLGQVMLGLGSTVPVTMQEMLHHIRAVRRAVKNALLVGDLPFASYHVSISDGIRNAGRLVQEGGANVVKLEGRHPTLVEKLVGCGIPVMGHLGYTPQSVHALGGPRIQARTPESAGELMQSARELQDAGASSLVLEAVPSEVAKEVTASLRIPTIGIGAGPHCDGQVLVITDLLGFGMSTQPKIPKFVKLYAQLDQTIAEAVQRFSAEVASGEFPDAMHSYS